MSFPNLRGREIDPAAATVDGIRVDFSKPDWPVEFWISVRQWGGANRDVYALAARLFAERNFEALPVDEKHHATHEIEVAVMSQCVVVDWGGAGVEDENGDTIPVTEKSARDLLTRHPDILARLLIAAQDQENFRVSRTTKTG